MYRKHLMVGLLTWALTPALQAADLLEVYQDAVQEDAELAIEKARLEQAKAQISQATSYLLPQVEASGTFSQTDMDGAPETSENLNVTLSANQALFNAEAWYGRQAADSSFAAVEAQYRDAEQGLLLRVAEAYFEALRAEDNLRSLQAEERAIQRQLEQVREQHEVGLIAITDVLEAQAAYDSVKAARLGAEGALMISYEGLEQITNQRYPQVATLSEDMPISNPIPNDRQAWVDTALESSLNLAAARAGLEAANKNLSSRRSRHLPTLSLFGTYSQDSDVQNRYGGDNQLTLGIQGSLEIYGGGRTSAEIREGSYSLEEARYNAELARRQILQQTRSLFTQVSTNVLTVQARQQSIRSAESALEATRSGYEVGTRNIVDVLNAERAVWSAQRDYDAARYDYVVNYLRLQRAAGQLDVADLQELNNWLSLAGR
ncbi:TolC family outer membrane protein [Marinospirillum perlucidum]|uniref:TolC family outer membrane protein n=1 Tax=Marinospirillum perlucidum TaxID=1982602 RepID=UPI000DF34172|nr:TolC family outer membrane protein [Marinospirillum perlucidum]